MRMLPLAVFAALLAGQAGAVEFLDNSARSLGEARASAAVSAVLRHLQAPETAKFRGLYRGTDPSQRGVVCGYVTARDKTGKVPKFQPFIYDPRTNDAVFMPLSDFRKAGVGPINVSLYAGAGCGALIGM
jgi:hypothetical protein